MKVYVAIAVEKGLITGFEDGTFRGQATLTRAEAATLLWRAFQFGSDNKTTAVSSNEYSHIENSDIAIQPNSKNTTSQGSSILTMATIEGAYWDTVNKVPEMYVKKKNNIYKIEINWDLNDRESIAWFFDATVDKSSGELVYKNGYKFVVRLKNDGTVQWELKSDKCEGSFSFEETFLNWNDYSEDLSERCKFAKSELFGKEDLDYSFTYSEAKNAIEKYMKVCMTAEIYENSTEKERRIAEKYNLVKGLLLNCFGYKDSDELLEKIDSVHSVALKLPDCIKAISRDEFSFSSCSASLRDTKLFVTNDKLFSGMSAQMNMNCSYDQKDFEAEIENVNTIASKHYDAIQLVVSLFAEDYNNDEFARLLREAYYKSNIGDSGEFEMYYGGYNIKITFEPNSYHYINIFIEGHRDKKQLMSESILNEIQHYENDKQNCNGALLCGKVQEIETGAGYCVLVFDFDTPKNISYETLDGEVISNQSFSSIQIVIDNYTYDMAGKHLEIIDYTIPFEAHTQHHIRPIVMLDAIVRIID